MVDPVSLGQAASAYGSAARVVENADKPLAADFGQLVTNAITGAVSGLDKAERIGNASALGNQSNLTDLVTAISAADLALHTIIAVRDRAISAYQDIIKMPI